MGFLLLTELESTGLISCKIKGLPLADVNVLEGILSERHLVYSKQEEFFEVDTHGVFLLNILHDELDYNIEGQSMVIERSDIGGRTVQIQKICWTLKNISKTSPSNKN